MDLKKIIFLWVAVCSFVAHLQAHWFEVSPEISDKALKELSTIRRFVENTSIAIYPMAKGKAVAIFHDTTPGWVFPSHSYFAYFYDGAHWSLPQKICDYKPEKLYHFSALSSHFVSNEADEAYFTFLGNSSSSKQETIYICQFNKNQWLAPVTISLKEFSQFDLEIDLEGKAVIIPLYENKIFYVKDQRVRIEDLKGIKHKSELLKDKNGFLSYLAAVEDKKRDAVSIQVRSWNGEEWKEEILFETSQFSEETLVLKEIQGQLLALWSEEGSLSSSIYSSHKTGENWSLPELVVDNVIVSYPVYHSSLDSLLTIWTRRDQEHLSSYDIVSRRWKEGSWEPIHLMHSSTGVGEWEERPYLFSITGNPKGAACVSWETWEFESSKFEMIHKSAIWDGSSWTQVHTDLSYYFPTEVDAEVKMDDKGSVLLAFTKKEKSGKSSTYRVSYLTYHANQWGSLKTLKGQNLAPCIFNYKGDLVLGWVDDNLSLFFSVYQNGDLSKIFGEKSDPKEVNRYLNLGD